MAWVRINKSDGTEEPVTEGRVLMVAGVYYKDIHAAIEAAKQGADIGTDFCIYRWKEV